jgi:hypothetical protein
MNVTLKAGTRPLTLGTVTNIAFDESEREGSIDVPLTRGLSRQGLGSNSAPISIDGLLEGSTRFTDYQQFNRFRMIQRSLKLESSLINTAVYLNSVSPGRIVSEFLYYKLGLVESLFKQVSDCEDLNGWISDGDLTNENDSPAPQEGDYCLKAAKTGTSIYAVYVPEDVVDLSGKEYVAFWLQTSNINVLSQAYLTLYPDNGDPINAYFQSKLLAVGTWYRVILHKSEFGNYQSFDWSQVSAFFIALTFNANLSISLILDDLGAYE